MTFFGDPLGDPVGGETNPFRERKFRGQCTRPKSAGWRKKSARELIRPPTSSARHPPPPADLLRPPKRGPIADQFYTVRNISRDQKLSSGAAHCVGLAGAGWVGMGKRDAPYPCVLLLLFVLAALLNMLGPLLDYWCATGMTPLDWLLNALLLLAKLIGCSVPAVVMVALVWVLI